MSALTPRVVLSEEVVNVFHTTTTTNNNEEEEFPPLPSLNAVRDAYERRHYGSGSGDNRNNGVPMKTKAT